MNNNLFNYENPILIIATDEEYKLFNEGKLFILPGNSSTFVDINKLRDFMVNHNAIDYNLDEESIKNIYKSVVKVERIKTFSSLFTTPESPCIYSSELYLLIWISN